MCVHDTIGDVLRKITHLLDWFWKLWFYRTPQQEAWRVKAPEKISFHIVAFWSKNVGVLVYMVLVYVWFGTLIRCPYLYLFDRKIYRFGIYEMVGTPLCYGEIKSTCNYQFEGGRGGSVVSSCVTDGMCLPQLGMALQQVNINGWCCYSSTVFISSIRIGQDELGLHVLCFALCASWTWSLRSAFFFKHKNSWFF